MGARIKWAHTDKHADRPTKGKTRRMRVCTQRAMTSTVETFQPPRKTKIEGRVLARTSYLQAQKHAFQQGRDKNDHQARRTDVIITRTLTHIHVQHLKSPPHFGLPRVEAPHGMPSISASRTALSFFGCSRVETQEEDAGRNRRATGMHAA